MRKVLFSNAKWLTIILLAIACDKTDSQEDLFNRKSLIENTSSRFISPGYEKFETDCQKLKAAINELVTSPNTDNLLLAQKQWISCKWSWKSIEMFRLGPIEEKSLYTSIDNWPFDKQAVEKILKSTSSINLNTVQNAGSTAKGLPVIESFIFDSLGNNDTVVFRIKNEAAIGQYLNALSEDLALISAQTNSDWKDYNDIFLASDGKDIGSSVNQLANLLIELTENAKNKRIGIPVGKRSMGNPLPQLVESPYANKSLDMLTASLISIRQVFSGENNSGQGIGFKAYCDDQKLMHSGGLLSDRILERLDKSIALCGDIDVELKKAVVSEPGKVNALYDEIQKAVVLLKADMMSGLGLLVTFSDNDGD